MRLDKLVEIANDYGVVFEEVEKRLEPLGVISKIPLIGNFALIFYFNLNRKISGDPEKVENLANALLNKAHIWRFDYPKLSAHMCLKGYELLKNIKRRPSMPKWISETVYDLIYRIPKYLEITLLEGTFSFFRYLKEKFPESYGRLMEDEYPDYLKVVRKRAEQYEIPTI